MAWRLHNAPGPCPISGRYLGMARPGRLLPGPEAPRSNPRGPGVEAGHRPGCGCAGLPHSSDYSWTRVPTVPSPRLLGEQQRKRWQGLGWLTEGSATTTLGRHPRSQAGRRHGSPSASRPGQRGESVAGGDSRARLGGATVGGQAQKRCRWRWAGPQVAEHILHGVQADQLG